jgi:hypothetical protein
MTEKHVLGLSGGKDSAALAVFMRQQFPELEIEYFFTDTGYELPEVIDFLSHLEGFLGKPILRLNPEKHGPGSKTQYDFEFWLREYNYFLPSARTRWCTRQLKLRPFEKWLNPHLDAGTTVHTYVAIRSDEPQRIGYLAPHPNMNVRYPFREFGIDKAGVLDLLQSSALGLPEYYRWRSRSGCSFCFFQQKIEWVNLKREHPGLFEGAKAFEKSAIEHSTPFTWCDGESLEELERPKRIAEIEADFKKRFDRESKRRPKNPLREGLDDIEIDDVYGTPEVSASCVICHK